MSKKTVKRLLTKCLAVCMALTLSAGMCVCALADPDDNDYIDDEPDGPQDPDGVPDYPWDQQPDEPYGPYSPDYPTDVPGGWYEPEPYSCEGYIVLSAASTNLNVGSTTSAHAEVYTNVYGCSLSVNWSSSNSGVASIESGGNDVTIRANGAGDAYISATLYINGSAYDTDGFYVTVNQPAPQYIGVNGININYTDITLKAGDSKKITASVSPSNANNKGVTYESNDETIAWVNSDGVVHANTAGSCIIRARSNENGYCAYCNVTVTGTVYKDLAVQGVKLDPSAITINVNQTTKFTPTVFPLGTSRTQVLWDSSNPNVAVVDAYGNVTAKSPGVANINVTTVDGNQKAYAVVTVVAATPKNATQGTVSASKTRSADFNFKVATEIMNAKQNATVTIVANSPMSYDTTVATLLASRPDIKLSCTFPFDGHLFTMTLPKKYDLKKQLDATGYVEWLDLCTKKGVDVKIDKK